MGVLPLWCGIPFHNLRIKRDTNSHVENWFRILKNNILVETENKRNRFKNKLLSIQEFLLEVEKSIRVRYTVLYLVIIRKVIVFE